LIKILGIESSCDETGAAVVTEKKEILSNVVYSQIAEHKSFGGVVPELAARAHLERIDVVVKKALEDAKLEPSELTAVAGTCGPGLIGGLIVGSIFAKTIAMAAGIPFIAANHIEAHALSVRLTEDVNFPYLLLLASGANCQWVVVRSCDRFEAIGKTVDDSVGEAFDKVAKLLGWGYPGGPIVEKMSRLGDGDRFSLPRPMCRKDSLNFSFAGLKTAVKIALKKCETEQDKIDLCASFQKAIVDVMVYKMKRALEVCRDKNVELSAVAISGGVAANKPMRAALQNVCDERGLRFCVPPISLCTDNGAMIAWLGAEKFQSCRRDDLRFAPRPRWPFGAKAE
jgi:N6-L-threonylcarbamoyladenine synthase